MYLFPGGDVCIYCWKVHVRLLMESEKKFSSLSVPVLCNRMKNKFTAVQHYV